MDKKGTYKIKEVYYTLQGEGFHTGRPAVFCRFSGCNLWTGREEERHKAICKFCDTDFWGTDGEKGGVYTSEQLAKTVKSMYKGNSNPYVVCTGGEPALQIDDELIDAFHSEGIEIGIESNGTLALPEGIDWICISPKANTELIVTNGDELKLVYPQLENTPIEFEHLDFNHFYLQPLDDENQEKHIQSCIQYCLENTKWKLSLQTHKFIGLD